MDDRDSVQAVTAARDTLWQFLTAAADGDDAAASAFVYPPSAALWDRTPTEVVADFHRTLGVGPEPSQIMGMSGTARLVEEPGVPQGLVGFGLVAGQPDEFRVLDGPTLAVAIALVWEDDRWWVWGTPSQSSWSEGRPIELPYADSGTANATAIIALEWLRALEPHLSALVSLDLSTDIGPVSQRERSHAIASIALLAFVVETNATRLVTREPGPFNRHPVDALESLFDRLGDAGWCDDLNEVIAVRNVLAHGHVWSLTYQWGPEGMSATADDRIYGHENARLRRAVRAGETTTRRLGLNIVPTSVGPADVFRCLSTIVRTLDFIAASDPNPAAVSLARIPLRIGTEHRSLEEIAKTY